MELIVLGAHGTFPGPGGAASGYLLRQDGFSLWVDLGSGTLANLQRHIGIGDVGAVVVSHAHPDHLVDVFTYFYARRYGVEEPPAPIPLYAPPGVLGKVRGMLSDSGGEELGSSFHLTELALGQGFECGPFKVRTAAMAHPVPTIGMRIEAGGATLAYTADTGATDAVVDLARDADLLLSEASWLGDPGDYPPDLHLTAGQAGEYAERAGAARLVLTHLKPTLDSGRSVSEAAASYEGGIVVAEVGTSLRVAE